MMTVLVAVVCLAIVQDTGQETIEEIFLLARQGKVAAGIEKARAYIQEHPQDAAGPHALGRMLFLEGRHAEATEALERCLELGPSQPWMVAWSHAVIGQAQAVLGNVDAARAHLAKAIELDATPTCTKTARQTLAALTGEGAAGATNRLVGKKVPDFHFEGLAGETYEPATFARKALLLKFGPSW